MVSAVALSAAAAEGACPVDSRIPMMPSSETINSPVLMSPPTDLPSSTLTETELSRELHLCWLGGLYDGRWIR